MKKRGKSNTFDHLTGLLDIVDDRSEAERQARWFPSRHILERLTEDQWSQTQRTAIVIAAYAKEHGGDTPPWSIVADILGISKSTAYSYGLKLAAGRQQVARFKHNAFYLTEATYDHPLLDEDQD